MARYALDNKQGVRQEVTAAEFEHMTGTQDTRPYVWGVYVGRLELDEVPEQYRDAVAESVAARTTFSGPYQLPAAQTLDILTGGAT